jgi:hypothetical protein
MDMSDLEGLVDRLDWRNAWVRDEIRRYLWMQDWDFFSDCVVCRAIIPWRKIC